MEVARQKMAASQAELHDWIQQLRGIDKEQMKFWADYSAEIAQAKVALAKVVCEMRDKFKPEVVDMLKFDDWVEGVVQWHLKKQEKQAAESNAEVEAEEQHKVAAASQGPGVAASQDPITSARPR